MATPKTRQQLIDYCLRKLGHPVIEINVADEQVEDRVDDALKVYFDYHFDGHEEIYLIHRISDADIANGYITLNDDILAIVNIWPLTDGQFPFGQGIFDVRYQIHLSDYMTGGAGWYRGGDLAYLEQLRRHISLINRMFNPDKSFGFNRKTNKLYIIEGLSNLQANYGGVLIKAYVKTPLEDSNGLSNVWSDEWLLRYATALIKLQWGNNLKKFKGVKLPGGTELDGEGIYREAEDDVKQLRKEVEENLQLPVDFAVG